MSNFIFKLVHWRGGAGGVLCSWMQTQGLVILLRLRIEGDVDLSDFSVDW